MRFESKRRQLAALWREFLPLSLSDVVMAVSDPLTTFSVSHLPGARLGLAALGVAKPIAVFFESPVIMLLHASNSLAGRGQNARQALWRFMVLLAAGLTLGLVALSIPAVFSSLGARWLGLGGELLETARRVLLFFLLWPAASGWRRYYQGLLIHAGHSRDVGRASLFRLAATASLLGLGVTLGFPGWVVGGSALLGGIVVEAATVTIVACLIRRVVRTQIDDDKMAPKSLGETWRFYRPLAVSMIVVWGSRALLVVAIARAVDSELALAAWPAAWGLILLVANATRMVQQVVIRRHKEVARDTLLSFAASVGAPCTIFLFILAITSFGGALVGIFVGGDKALVERIQPVLVACALVPILVALQNAFQGFLIGRGSTRTVNIGAWIGAVVLLGTAFTAVSIGTGGALAAGIAMLVTLVFEVGFLGFTLHKQEGTNNESGAAVFRGVVSLRALLSHGSKLKLFHYEKTVRPFPPHNCLSVIRGCTRRGHYDPLQLQRVCDSGWTADIETQVAGRDHRPKRQFDVLNDK